MVIRHLKKRRKLSIMIIVVGSTNPAKISAARIAFKKVFPKQKIEIIGVDAKSKVSNQPMSDQESIRGAINRAKDAFKSVKNANFAVGIEGGLHKIGKNWFESGLIAVIDKSGKVGLASSSRWQVSGKVINKLNAENELSYIYEQIANVENAKDIGGVMSLVTNKHVPRDIAYTHGIIFALAPFISNPDFWD